MYTVTRCKGGVQLSLPYTPLVTRLQHHQLSKQCSRNSFGCLRNLVQCRMYKGQFNPRRTQKSLHRNSCCMFDKMIDEKSRLLYYSYLLKISGKLQKRTTNPTDRLAMEFMVSNRTESPLIVRKEQNVKSKIACTD